MSQKEIAMQKFDKISIGEYEKYGHLSNKQKAAAIRKEHGAVVRSSVVVDHDRLVELRKNILSARDADPEDIWAWRYRRDIGVLLRQCEDLRKLKMALIRRINDLERRK